MVRSSFSVQHRITGVDPLYYLTKTELRQMEWGVVY